jgi:hypothetical protein
MVSEYFTTIQISIGEKLGSVVMAASAFAAGIGISFYFGPIFAAICFAYYPLMFVFVAGLGGAVKKAAIGKMVILK